MISKREFKKLLKTYADEVDTPMSDKNDVMEGFKNLTIKEMKELFRDLVLYLTEADLIK